MARFDIRHEDPAPTARSAAIRSAREADPATREHARRLTMSERLRVGFEISRFASRLRPTR